MGILVFGRAGQLATDLRRLAKVVSLGREDADLRVPGQAARAITDHRPSAVINASAYTAVDQAERAPEDAGRLNSAAPAEIARTCADMGIPLLHVSTDYVFDGSGETPRAETAPTQPLNVYGASKLAGEEAIRGSGGPALILRTSWVFSAHGANFVKTMLRLSETRDHLDVVADQIGGPTPSEDIAATLLTCAAAMIEGHPGGTYHYGGTPAVSWADFAREIFRQSGRATTVADIPTQAYPTPARRPLNSRLDCAKLASDFGINQPSWQDGLSRVLRELGA